MNRTEKLAQVCRNCGKTYAEHTKVSIGRICDGMLFAAVSTPPAALDRFEAETEVWIVTEFAGGGIRGVFLSQPDAEAEIEAIRTEHPDLKRSDFVIRVERIRSAAWRRAFTLGQQAGTEQK